MDQQYFLYYFLFTSNAKATPVYMRVLELFLFFQQTIIKMNTLKSSSKINDFENEQIKIIMINAYF